jgi:hypothetical protein
MSDENLNQEEKDLSKSPYGSESEDALDELFKSDDDSQEELEDSEKVKKLEERLGNIEKGVKKFFSENGRKQKETEKQPEPQKEASATPAVHSVLKTLYFDKHPEAQDYWEQVEKEAKLLGRDPFELYESSAYLKGEAKARHDAKIEEETNKKKIDTPSNGTGTPKKNISDVKPEDVEKLKPSEKAEWVKAQARKEREQDE